MSVTFSAVRYEEPNTISPIAGSPELNVSNLNAADLLWFCFDVPRDEFQLVGDLETYDAIKLLQFWVKHDGVESLSEKGGFKSAPGGCTVIDYGGSYPRVHHYASRLREILAFCVKAQESCHQRVMLGWG